LFKVYFSFLYTAIKCLSIYHTVCLYGGFNQWWTPDFKSQECIKITL
jgi:hypothetical protein